MGSSFILPPPGQPKTGPDPSFRGAPQPNAVTFNLDKVGPPSPLYIQRDDFLSVYVNNSHAGIQLNVKGRLLLAPLPRLGQPDNPGAPDPTQSLQSSNVIEPFVLPIFPAATRATQNFAFPLTEGYLLGMDVSLNAGVLRPGETYVQVYLARGAAGAGLDLVPLIQNYVTSIFAPGWPGGSMMRPADGGGNLHTQLVSNPAAGADWTFTVPTGARMRITSLAASFAASATAANRNVNLFIDDGVNAYWTWDPPASITAGQGVSIVATGTSVPTGIIPTDLEILIPPNLIMPAGHRIRTVTNGIQAGDQWSGITIGVEEWLEA